MAAKANLAKSSAYFGVVPREIREEIMVKSLIRKFLQKVDCWSAKMLLYTGSLQLIKFVLIGVEAYWCQDYLLVFFIVAYVANGLLASSHGARVRVQGNDSPTFNVLNYGAIGDGKQDDTLAFSKAWSDVCNSSNDTPTLVVPLGKTFLVKSILFKGPCKSTRIHVEVQGNIVAPDSIDEWGECQSNTWLQFEYVDNLIVDGQGVIDGRGSIWWNKASIINHDAMINALRFQSCNGFQLRGLTHKDSPGSHITLSGANNSTISNVNIIAPEDSPNTDGIDISSSTNLQILHSTIATGDDCIAMGSHTSQIYISNITCGPGHGISVGSLGKDGAEAKVEEIHVRNCTFINSSNGARIKTWQGGSGYARNITYDDIILTDVNNPIIIDQYYCFGQCKIQPLAVAVSNVKFSGFHGTSSSKAAITLNCSQTVPCTNIQMADIDIAPFISTINITSFCESAQVQEDSSVVPHVNCNK
ncbi:probable polygalacturonase At3g15720 [Beta vulgaris subsp. vulgaris]|uniref:probable polygalacturonase At3g15720 n=1 Tax=Beta vulgaris subsp. vulgaris TaxID=3555 RepID=UPI0020372FCE|nr:probable polygalacturonase At3g15720 [Beta vulgaris subsp. vulgaris]